MKAELQIQLREIYYKLDQNDLREASLLLKEAYNKKGREAVFKFSPGEMVTFRGRNGLPIHGTVEKINITRVLVTETGPMGKKWTVAPGMLHKDVKQEVSH